jgi:hypothetical protein
MEEILIYVFKVCVLWLLWLSGMLGISYAAINVIIFCVLWPLLTVWLIWKLRVTSVKLRKAKGDLREAESKIFWNKAEKIKES